MAENGLFGPYSATFTLILYKQFIECPEVHRNIGFFSENSKRILNFLKINYCVANIPITCKNQKSTKIIL